MAWWVEVVTWEYCAIFSSFQSFVLLSLSYIGLVDWLMMTVWTFFDALCRDGWMPGLNGEETDRWRWIGVGWWFVVLRCVVLW